MKSSLVRESVTLYISCWAASTICSTSLPSVW